MERAQLELQKFVDSRIESAKDKLRKYGEFAPHLFLFIEDVALGKFTAAFVPSVTTLMSQNKKHFIKPLVQQCWEAEKRLAAQKGTSIRLIAIVLIMDTWYTIHPLSVLEGNKPLPKPSQLPDRSEGISCGVYEENAQTGQTVLYERKDKQIIFGEADVFPIGQDPRVNFADLYPHTE